MSHVQASSSLTVVGHIIASPGKGEELQKALLDTVTGTSADPGNVDFVLHRSTVRDGEFLLIEHWKDEAALESHKKQPVYLDFLKLAQDRALLGGTPKETHWTVITGA